MCEFEMLPISIVVRDSKGKKYTLNYAHSQALCDYLPEEFECNELTILVVAINNQIVWTALGSTKPMTLIELIQFFR